MAGAGALMPFYSPSAAGASGQGFRPTKTGDWRRYGFGRSERFRTTDANPQPVTVERPQLGDYLGGLGPAPQIGPVERSNEASREGIDVTRRDVNRFRAEYNDPASGSAFRNLMSLAGERTAAAVGDIGRQSRTAAQRAGYAGGFHAREGRADAERLKAVATAGFEAAHEIRGQALEGYGKALESATTLTSEYNRLKVQEGMANADRTAQAATQQAMLNLEHMGLSTQAHQAYASAKSEAQRLQAQLDSHFQDQLIDAGRYEQMSESVQAQFVASMMQLEEESRQFDITTAQRERELYPSGAPRLRPTSTGQSGFGSGAAPRKNF